MLKFDFAVYTGKGSSEPNIFVGEGNCWVGFCQESLLRLLNCIESREVGDKVVEFGNLRVTKEEDDLLLFDVLNPDDTMANATTGSFYVSPDDICSIVELYGKHFK